MLDSGEASSELVEHKYGEDAGGVTRDGCSIVQSVAEGSQAYRRIGLQSFAKQSVTGTLHTMNDSGIEETMSMCLRLLCESSPFHCMFWWIFTIVVCPFSEMGGLPISSHVIIARSSMGK